MGIYVNPGNITFQKILNSDIYIDKTDLVSVTNTKINKLNCYIAKIPGRAETFRCFWKCMKKTRIPLVAVCRLPRNTEAWGISPTP